MAEEQFILRLPPALAAKMRLALSSKSRRGENEAVPNFDMEFASPREARVTVDGAEAYRGVVHDLPAICETHKTSDKRNFFKSGDVHQVVIVDEASKWNTGQPPPDPLAIRDDHDYLLPDGLTPGAKGAAQRFSLAQPHFPTEVIRSVEDQMKYILDNKITFVKKKDDADHEELVEEEDGEPEPEPEPEAGHDAAARPPEPEQRPVVQSSPAPSPAPEGDVAAPSPPPEPAEAVPMETDGGDNDDNEDIDDFAEALADDLLEEEEPAGDDPEVAAGKRRIELEKLEKLVADQQKVVDGLRKQAANNPNPIMKKRLESKAEEARQELARRQGAVGEFKASTTG